MSFYTETLGFELDRQNLPAFGPVSIGARWPARAPRGGVCAARPREDSYRR
ncbi:MAG: hypothetical protein ACRERY_16880 [Pseudomonas sp.]